MERVILLINSKINFIVWGIPVIILMLGVGIYFTFRTSFFQFRGIKRIFKATIGSCFGKKSKVKSDKKGFSPLQAFFTSLAATVGTGSVTGVAAALATGGAGAIFWMWVSAFFGMMTAFAENVIGGIFRKKMPNGEYRGGAMYYMEKGLNAKWMARFFAFCCVLASFGMGNMTQSNSIATALSEYKIPPFIVGLLVTIVLVIIIAGGSNRLGKVTERTIPFIAGFYIIGCLVIIAINNNQIIPCFQKIFSEAFCVKSAVGGGIGTVIATGFKRGIFSNEAGLGTTCAVHGSSQVDKPVNQGMWAVFEVFVDTIVICTLSALVVLVTKTDYATGGSEVIVNAFQKSFHSFGGVFVALSIIFFAFGTLIGWSFIGEQAWKYIFPKTKYLYKILFSLSAFLGAVTSLELVWGLSDTFNGLMIIPNLTAVILLRKVVLKEFKREKL
ncbi:MAG: sodium:alanine symporter family protein [Clostridiales bacterium]|nr:sodium:alanine symporter family protein [Clostridiales bacterium]